MPCLKSAKCGHRSRERPSVHIAPRLGLGLLWTHFSDSRIFEKDLLRIYIEHRTNSPEQRLKHGRPWLRHSRTIYLHSSGGILDPRTFFASFVMKLDLSPSPWAFCFLSPLVTLMVVLCVFPGVYCAEVDVNSKDIPRASWGPSKQTNSNGNSYRNSIPLECPEKDEECEADRQGLEAIRSLHLLIDDDHNGNVDQHESDEFLRDELQYTDGFERQELFHNNDKLISVDDLWRAWKFSTVDSEFALRSAETLLSRVRASPLPSWSDAGPESLTLPYTIILQYTKTKPNLGHIIIVYFIVSGLLTVFSKHNEPEIK
ncbi:stromal interaction molecule 1 [Plakobranchus ocellatus]|uniref:Stromal interaction molecule 1 n=1 Tax=Plakobranchus ocellatus TaxID=259542 RepID=A0AAV4AIF8_9GAST|nr:stromal interaction molecule 1 [Plakobranchus ocellatus]